MRVIFCGTLCPFSMASLRLLIEAGHDLCAIVIPTDRSIGGRSIVPLNPPQLTAIPLIETTTAPTVVSIAWEHRIPVFQVNRLAAAETYTTFEQWQADVACVACFPKRMPAALLSMPRWGFLNIHPSLLPHYRGPYPLFWMLRQGDRRFGVTIHFMDEQWDTGDIAAQAEVALPDGISGEEADSTLAQYGAELLLEVLDQLENGHLVRRSQPLGGSYFSAPQAADFEIDITWSAQRAFNFMRGTSEWLRFYSIEVAGQRFILKQALFYSSSEVLDQPYRLFRDQIDIQFSPGVLRALIA
ncbi:MAG TPA: formyltransferase family protein [Anaerolineae bacterium]|nr:formyltransferase family protein [Anaerolineae bacterium]